MLYYHLIFGINPIFSLGFWYEINLNMVYLSILLYNKQTIMKKNLQIIIEGKVQGVAFRWQACKTANDLGVKGYVKNLQDGTVFIEAEGESQDLDTFVQWCRQGPVNAEVKKVTIVNGDIVNFTNFEIRF